MNTPLERLLHLPQTGARTERPVTGRQPFVMPRVRSVLLKMRCWVSLDELSRLTRVQKRTLSTVLSNPRTNLNGLQRRRGWYAANGVLGEPPVPAPIWQLLVRALDGRDWVEKHELSARTGASATQINHAVNKHAVLFETRRNWLRLSETGRQKAATPGR